MPILDSLQPIDVFKYFEQISSIPHSSGNVSSISQYLCEFAKEHKLEYVQDEMLNVVIYKDATPGYEDEPGVIIQGHMDMVAAVEKGYEQSINMMTDPLKLAVSGDSIYAEHTTLGGDDGIAVAMALALLDSTEIQHPALAVIITVDEEVGMEGAAAISPEVIRYNRLLNIDNEVEGQIITGCAGGARVELTLPLEKANIQNAECLTITLDDCIGGHSGIEIDKGHANSNILMGRILYELLKRCDNILLVDITGGTADNAIAPQTTMTIAIDCSLDNAKDNINTIKALIADIFDAIRLEYATIEPNMSINIDHTNNDSISAVSAETTKMISNLLKSLPNGVISMSADVEGLVETSLNLGRIWIDVSTLNLMYSVRSSVESAKQALIDKLQALASLAGAETRVSGDYPGWRYRVDSPLRQKCIEIYHRLYNAEPQVEAIHAGLECGFLISKKDDLDCVSIGPDIYDIHTPRERLSISSTQRTWEYLCEILKSRS